MQILYSEKYPLLPIKITNDLIFVEFSNNSVLSSILEKIGFLRKKLMPSNQITRYELTFNLFLTKIKLVQSLLKIPQDQIDELLNPKKREQLKEHNLLFVSLAQLKIRPYQYQIEGINYALHNNYCIIGSQMGLGKTLQALGVAVIYKKIVICCPASLKLNWKNEINKFTDLTSFVIMKTKDIELCPHDVNIVILNFDILDKCKKLFEKCDLIICDEMHKLSNPKSKMSKIFFKILLDNKPKRFIGLSGTAINNRVGAFFNLIKIISQSPVECGIRIQDDKRINVHFRFQKFFSYERSNCFGSQFYGLRNYSELKKLLVHKYIRHTVDEHLPDMPDIIRKEIEFKSNIGSIDEQFLLEAFEKSNKALPIDENLSTIKRKSAESKVNSTYEFIKQVLETEEKLIVFSDHISPIEELFNKLKDFNPVKITGKISIIDRQKSIDDFQNGNARVFLGTIGSSSTGLTLTSSHIVIFNDCPWIPAHLLQAEARARRIGQTNAVISYFIISSKIDKIIINTLISKAKLLNRVLSDGKEREFNIDK